MKAIVAIAFSLLFASPAASQSAPTPLDWDVIAHAFVAIDPLSYEEGIRIWEFPFPLADNASGKLPDYLQRSAVPVSELQAISRTISEAHEWSRSSTLSGKVSGGYASIGGSFEGSKSELRKRMSSTFWEGTQVVGNYHIATLTLDPFGAPLSPSVRREFIMIAHTLAKGSVVARTAAKSLMDDFLDVAGVEVVISVDYGVSLEQNHLLDISEWSDYTKESSEMCASAHFASYASAKVSYQVSEEELNKYRNAIRVESVISSGGHPFLSNDTMDSWLTGAVQRPVPIRRKTIPLSEIITPLLFRPEDNLTLSEIQELRKLVVNCTADYWAENTRYGCPKRGNPYYDPRANAADYSSCAERANYTLGGFYQTSTCPQYVTKNMLTMDTSCPAGFNATLIMDPYTITGRVECGAHCDLFNLFHLRCGERCQRVEPDCTIHAYECIATPEAQLHNGAFYGGGFTTLQGKPVTVNLVTGAASCPPKYYQVPMLHLDSQGSSVWRCVAPADSGSLEGYVGWGGDFSCQHVNPLSGAFRCSHGFERRSYGNWVQGCELVECIAMQDVEGDDSLRRVRPGEGDPEPVFVEYFEDPENNTLWVPMNLTDPAPFYLQYRRYKAQTRQYVVNDSLWEQVEPADAAAVAGAVASLPPVVASSSSGGMSGYAITVTVCLCILSFFTVGIAVWALRMRKRYLFIREATGEGSALIGG